MRSCTLKKFMYPFHALYTLYRQSCEKINTTHRDGRNEFKHTTQIDVDMARSPANGERPRKLRAVGNFVAEESTPLPDSELPEAVKRCQLVQQTPKPRRPFDRCPNSEAIVDRLAVQERECKRLRILFLRTEHRFREEMLRLAVEEKECKRLHARRRVLLQRTEHRTRQEILRLAVEERGDPADFICPDIIHVPVDHEERPL